MTDAAETRPPVPPFTRDSATETVPKACRSPRPTVGSCGRRPARGRRTIRAWPNGGFEAARSLVAAAEMLRMIRKLHVRSCKRAPVGAYDSRR